MHPTNGGESLIRAQRFHRLFLGRDDACTRSYPTDDVDQRGKRKFRYDNKHQPVTDDLWQSHLSGEVGLVVFPLRAESVVQFGAIDVDVYQDFDFLALIRAAAERQPHLVPCRSKSGGLHLYLFTAVPVSAHSMREALTEARSNLGLQAEPATEIFPKSDEFNPDGFAGNSINMPYFGGSRPAIRPDGTEMTAEEFLDHAERLRFTPAAKNETARKDYQRGAALGGRWNFMKSALAKELQAYPDSTFEDLMRYAEQIIRPKLDPNPSNEEWDKEYRPRKIAKWLLAKQASKADQGSKPKSKTRDALGLETVDEILATCTIAVDAAGQIYDYDEGVGTYVSDDYASFFKVLARNFRDNPNPYMAGKADLEKLVMNLRIDAPKFWPEPPRDEFNTRTGIVNVKTRTVRPHDPNFLYPNQFDVAFDESATCPHMDKFLADVLYEEEVIVFYEMLGYVLTPDTSLQKAFLLKGGGGNGKSIFLKMLEFMLGRRNYSAVPYDELEDTFSLYPLVNKLANIDADVVGKRLPKSENFKRVTGGDVVHVKRKYHDGADVNVYARIFLSCNVYPRSDDNSQGFFRRWLVLPFGKKDFRKEGADYGELVLEDVLLPRLQAEAPGILNRALDALVALKERKEFTESVRMRAALAEFQSLTDSLSLWLDRNTICGPNVRIQQKNLRAAYDEFCKAKDYPVIGPNEFSEKVVRYRPQVETRQIHGERYFIGVGLRAGEPYDLDPGFSRLPEQIELKEQRQ
jgi:putative DNA primase/helicase